GALGHGIAGSGTSTRAGRRRRDGGARDRDASRARRHALAASRARRASGFAAVLRCFAAGTARRAAPWTGRVGWVNRGQTMQARVSFVVVSVVAASLLVGCKNEKETPASGAPEPPKSADPVKALDPELAEAVAAASANAKAAERPAAGTQEGGPPPNGIFPPGAADREAKVGAPPKITLGSEGAPPRQALSFVPKPGTRVA